MRKKMNDRHDNAKNKDDSIAANNLNEGVVGVVPAVERLKEIEAICLQGQKSVAKSEKYLFERLEFLQRYAKFWSSHCKIVETGIEASCKRRKDTNQSEYIPFSTMNISIEDFEKRPTGLQVRSERHDVQFATESSPEEAFEDSYLKSVLDDIEFEFWNQVFSQAKRDVEEFHFARPKLKM